MEKSFFYKTYKKFRMKNNYPPEGIWKFSRIYERHLLDGSKGTRIHSNSLTPSFLHNRFNNSLLYLPKLDLTRNLFRSLPINFSEYFLPLLLAFFTVLHDELLKQVKYFSTKKMTSHQILNIATWSAGRESFKLHAKQNTNKFKDNIEYDSSDDNHDDDNDYFDDTPNLFRNFV
jgi:hypothetical protein